MTRTCATTDDHPYAPPQPTGGRCPHCGAVVLLSEYRDGVHVKLPRALTPVFGREHACQGGKEDSV